MKIRLIIASAIMALLSISLCGCTDSPPAAPLPETSEPASSVSFADEKSEPESLPEITSESESSPQSTQKYTAQNAASYTVKITSYENGKPVGASVETYDEHGNVIKVVSKNSRYFYSYEYNADGTIRVKYDDDYREEYEYENGLEIKRTKYDSFGREVSVMTHTYDEHGNEVAMTYEVLGSVDSYAYEYTYDENGIWKKMLLYNSEGGLRGTYTRVLGENGEDLSGTLEETLGEENSLFAYELKYDENGREVELHSSYTLGGKVAQESRILTEYDEQGRVSRKEEYSLNGGEQLISTEVYDYTI